MAISKITDNSLNITDLSIADDLTLASDSAVINFGADSDVTITHDPDDGLVIKSKATADDNPLLLTLQTGETDLAANDVIGKIAFQAPDEGTGTDAILVSAAIQAVAEGDHSSSSNATSLQLMTGSSEAATTKMTLTSGGKAGFGTTSPDGALHVKGVSDHGRIVLESGGTSGSNNGTFMQFHNHGGTEIAQIAIDEGATDQGQMVFKTGGTDESMRITHDHRVGIGVTSPGSLFNIASSGGFMGIERFLGGDAAGPGIAFYKSRGSSQNSKTVVAENDVLGQIAVYGADGSTWVPGGYMRWMVNDTPGSSDMPCGIEFGTTNNGQAVAGIAGVLNQVNAKFPGATTSTGNSANCQVDGNGRLHTSTSSKIYKTAIEDLEDEYADKIFSLEPKFYKSNPETVGDDTTKIKPDWSYYGLLAEDVEKIEPRLVTYKLTEEKQVDSGSKGEQGETMYKTVTSNLDTPVPMNVNYDRITAHLINVVKRFKTRIEELETSNADLVKRVEALESA